MIDVSITDTPIDVEVSSPSAQAVSAPQTPVTVDVGSPAQQTVSIAEQNVTLDVSSPASQTVSIGQQAISLDVSESASVLWGNITGTLSNQTDLQAELDIDHGSISGLADDDHSQYHNDTRGDARYLRLSGANADQDIDVGAHKITAEEFAGWGICPIGTILPWAKSLTGTPALPDGWAQCDGQTLSDADSPYDGVTLPDLNGALSGIQRFPRGAATSGGLGGHDDHIHSFSGGGGGSTTSIVFGKGTAQSGSGVNVGTHTPDHIHTFNFNFGGATGQQIPSPVDSAGYDPQGTDMLPPYIDVVYIMRVK